MFQALEARQFLSGAVHAQVHHGTLILQGDDSANAVLIDRNGPDKTLFRVTPLDGTEIDGSAKPVVFVGVDRGVSADMGGGNDSLTLSGLRIFGAVQIQGGDGNDSLLVRSTRTSGGLTWLGGAGDDSLVVRRSIVQRDLDLDGGEGHDRYALATDHIRQQSHLVDTSGSSSIDLDQLSIDKVATFRTGNSIDHVNATDSTFKSDALFSLTGGNDQMKVRGTVFYGASPINGGSGHNVIDREVILSWDFADGQQGWEAGFSDYSSVRGLSGDGKESTITPQEFYQLQSGIRPLPSGLPRSTGFTLSGQNNSDSLFMYLSRHLSTADGLQKGLQYRAHFRISFASSVPAGLLGVGGSPAESVFLKTGATSRHPRVSIDPATGQYTLNIDKGDQAFGGHAATVAGNIANGLLASSVGLKSPYQEVTREHTHRFLVRANSNGDAWLLIGTDSGFEGTTTLYYTRVSVELTPVFPNGNGLSNS